MTAKPQIYLLNGKPEDASEELKDKIRVLGATYIVADLFGDKCRGLNQGGL